MAGHRQVSMAMEGRAACGYRSYEADAYDDGEPELLGFAPGQAEHGVSTRQDDPGCGDGAALTPNRPDESRRQFGGARRGLDALRDHDIAAPKALKPVIL
jgi:hypothetical protein